MNEFLTFTSMPLWFVTTATLVGFVLIFIGLVSGIGGKWAVVLSVTGGIALVGGLVVPGVWQEVKQNEAVAANQQAVAEQINTIYNASAVTGTQALPWGANMAEEGVAVNGPDGAKACTIAVGLTPSTVTLICSGVEYPRANPNT